MKSQNFLLWLQIMIGYNAVLINAQAFVDFDENEDIIPPPVQHAPKSLKHHFIKHAHPDFIPSWVFISIIFSCTVVILGFLAYCIYSIIRKHRKNKRRSAYVEDDEPISLDQIKLEPKDKQEILEQDMLVDEEDIKNNKQSGLNELIEYDSNFIKKTEPRRQDFRSAIILKKYYDSEMDNIFPLPQNQKQLTEDSMGDDVNGSQILPNISITPRRRNYDGVNLEMTSKSNLWNAQIVPETLEIGETYEPPVSSTRDLKFYTNRNMESMQKAVHDKSKLMTMN